MVKCLVQGPARAGKTHVKALIMKKQLQRGQSPSTDCVEKAARAICTNMFKENNESDWKEVDTTELKEILTREMKRAHTSGCYTPVKPVKQDDFPSTNRNEELQNDLPSSASTEVDTDEVQDAVDLTFFEELKKFVSNCKGKAMDQKWIYFVDSGGQPQFHNVFQAFVKNTSILLLVFNLERRLTDLNDSHFQDLTGQDIKLEDALGPRVIDSLKSIASTLHSTALKKDRKIFFVGTHKDSYEKNPKPSESIEEKEEKLCDLFDKKEIQLFSSRSSKASIIFPVNGLQAEEGEFEDKVVAKIRQEIFNHFEKSKERPIPLRWFVLQLALDEKAASLNRRVLTFKECVSTAKVFCIYDSSKLKIALKFLEKCSLLLYPDDDLVFTDPQALVSVFSTMLIKFYKLKEEFVGSLTEYDDAKKAILTSSVFNHLQTDSPEAKVLTNEKIISIFKRLLIASKVDKDKYFIPAFLPILNTQGIRILTSHEKSSTVPLVLLFADQCAPSGLFCALVVYLTSKEWEIDTDAGMYSNAITLFYNKRMPNVKVILIDSFKYYELHCSEEDRLKEVQENVKSAIKLVIKQRDYKCELPRIAFFKSCKEKKCNGLAIPQDDGSISCFCRSYKAEAERKWLQENKRHSLQRECDEQELLQSKGKAITHSNTQFAICYVSCCILCSFEEHELYKHSFFIISTAGKLILLFIALCLASVAALALAVYWSTATELPPASDEAVCNVKVRSLQINFR